MIGFMCLFRGLIETSMKKVLKYLFSRTSERTARAQKPKAQSLVEFAITLPLLLMILGGVVEFGFALNYYLSLIDATREAARFYSNEDPFTAGGADDMTFYSDTAAMVRASLDPQVVNPSYQGRRIVLDPGNDDVIITAFSASNGNVIRFPSSGSYHLYNNESPVFTDSAIESLLVSGAPNAGILLVEVHYNYHQVLRLPWLLVFVPDPFIMRAYTIMPLAAAQPD